MQQSDIQNVWHPIKNCQARKKPENTTQKKKRPINDTNNPIICTQGHCNHMPYNQEGNGQEVEKKNRKLSIYVK